MTLSEVETRLRDATYYAQKVGFEQGEYSQAFRAVQRDIQELTALRNRMLADIEYRNSYQPQSMGYSRQSAYPTQQPLQHPTPLARPYDSSPRPYSVPVFGGSSDEANNKYSSKAEDKTRYTIEYPVGNSDPEPIKQNLSKPLEGHEFEPIVINGLEARKEENNDSYKWEIYGKASDEFDSVKAEPLPKDIVVVSTAQLFCKKNKTYAVSGVLSKKLYVNAVEGDDSEKLNELIKSGKILDTLVKLYTDNRFICEYINSYYTDIYNHALIGGVKKRQWITSILEDLEAMQEIIEKDPARKRAYMENVLSEINKDLGSNVVCKLTENIIELDHSIPFIYVDDFRLLGNLLSMPKGERYSIREDSNPVLYKVIKSYLKEKNRTYVVIYAMNEKGEVMKFDTILDIYGNYIIQS